MATDVNETLPMPRTKGEAQRVLRAFDITGMKVDAIAEDRIYVLSQHKLSDDGVMRRAAHTVVLFNDTANNVVRAELVDGWVVGQVAA